MDQNVRPEISIEKVTELAAQLYGLTCIQVKELNGYDDRNFEIRAETGKYVFKVMNSLDSNDFHFVEGCNSMMIFLGETTTFFN